MRKRRPALLWCCSTAPSRGPRSTGRSGRATLDGWPRSCWPAERARGPHFYGTTSLNCGSAPISAWRGDPDRKKTLLEHDVEDWRATGDVPGSPLRLDGLWWRARKHQHEFRSDALGGLNLDPT